MSTKNMLFVLSLIVAGFAGGLNAQDHIVEEVNEWNKRLESEEMSLEAKKDALLRIAAISTPEYVAREKVVIQLGRKHFELEEKKDRCRENLFDPANLSCIEAYALQKQLISLQQEFRPLAHKAVATDAYGAWYNNLSAEQESNSSDSIVYFQ